MGGLSSVVTWKFTEWNCRVNYAITCRFSVLSRRDFPFMESHKLDNYRGLSTELKIHTLVQVHETAHFCICRNF